MSFKKYVYVLVGVLLSATMCADEPQGVQQPLQQQRRFVNYQKNLPKIIFAGSVLAGLALYGFLYTRGHQGALDLANVVTSKTLLALSSVDAFLKRPLSKDSLICAALIVPLSLLTVFNMED